MAGTQNLEMIRGGTMTLDVELNLVHYKALSGELCSHFS